MQWALQLLLSLQQRSQLWPGEVRLCWQDFGEGTFVSPTNPLWQGICTFWQELARRDRARRGKITTYVWPTIPWRGKVWTLVSPLSTQHVFTQFFPLGTTKTSPRHLPSLLTFIFVTSYGEATARRSWVRFHFFLF